MPKVTHIIFECGRCGTQERVRAENVGGGALADRKCPKCGSYGCMHVAEVVVEASFVRG